MHYRKVKRFKETFSFWAAQWTSGWQCFLNARRFESACQPGSMWGVFMFSLCLCGVFPRYSSVLPQSKGMHLRLIGVNVSVDCCCWPCDLLVTRPACTLSPNVRWGLVPLPLPASKDKRYGWWMVFLSHTWSEPEVHVVSVELEQDTVSQSLCLQVKNGTKSSLPSNLQYFLHFNWTQTNLTKQNSKLPGGFPVSYSNQCFAERWDKLQFQDVTP